MAQKSASLYVRIEPDLKEEAENILTALGISASGAVNMFYKQIVLHQGLPFEVALPVKKPLDLSEMSVEELHRELEKGFLDNAEGRTMTVKEAFEQIRKEYGDGGRDR